MKINKKIFYCIFLSIVIAVIGPNNSRSEQVDLSMSEGLNKSGVVISTDRTEYAKGEIIKVIVTNKLNTSVFYSTAGDRFWGIEYFKNNKWVNPAYERDGNFQLTKKDIGETCYIALYERMPPVELKSGSALQGQWNQKVCPFGANPPTEERTVKYIENGQYRIIFIYGLEVSHDDPYQLSKFQTISSNNFTIK